MSTRSRNLAIPVEDILTQEFHESHGSVFLKDGRVVVNAELVVLGVERPGEIILGLDRRKLGAAEVAHHELHPKVVDVGFKAHEFGRNGEVLVDKGRV